VTTLHATSTHGLRARLRGRRLAFFVGEGGVGKTSCAAGLALALAAEGKRVAVLTIDPAPRLGDALGLPAIDAEWREVSHPAVIAAGGRLMASRLDTKTVFDRLVSRFAPSPAVAGRILQSPIYASVSGQLSGADSYMAFQQLHELLSRSDHEILVVDTPPAQHADEILGAPKRLAKLIETGATAVVADPALAIARAGSRVAGFTVSLLLKALERVTGSRLRADLADFAGSFQDVLSTLTRRASEVTETLRSDETVVVEVVRPDAHSMVAAKTLRRSLAAADLRVAFTVVNRMTPPAAAAAARTESDSIAPTPPSGTADAAQQIRAAMQAIREQEARAVAALQESLERESGAGQALMKVDSIEREIESPDLLLELGRRILDGRDCDTPKGG
jgi:anion-transporting  ArsA/GET3 family ATPase